MWSSVKGATIVNQIETIDRNSPIGYVTELATHIVSINKRRFTDRYFLILQTICFICLAPLMNYCMKYGALERLTNGYDSCRNICGQQNVMQDELKKSWCDGLDMRYRPYLLVFRPDGIHHYNATRLNQRHNDAVVPIELKDNVQRVCLVNCSVYQHHYQYKNRCILEKSNGVTDVFWGKSGLLNFLLEVAEDFVLYWRELLWLSGISLVLSFILLMLFQFLIEIAVWLVLIGLIIVGLCGSIYMWTMWKYWKDILNQPNYLAAELEKKRCETYLAFAVIGNLLCICMIAITFTVKSKVESVTQLFKETGKAVVAMPLLLFQPLVTAFAVGVVTTTWFYFYLWIESAGHDVELYDDFYEYQKDGWIYFARWYNTFIALWSIEFFLCCQHLIVAGAVSVWYFANDRNVLGTPIFYGFYNLVRYHLGSISCGSLAILMCQMVKGILNMLQKYLKNPSETLSDFLQKSCVCCISCFDNFLKNVTRKAYVEIALYGDSFYQAGKNANKSLNANVFHARAINSTGDFVLFLGKIMVSVITTLAAVVLFQEKEDVQHAWVLAVFSGWVGYLASHCILSMLEMVMDTIFLCFCEDCKYNDGITKPYFMTRDLLKFIINSKKTENILNVETYTDYVHED